MIYSLKRLKKFDKDYRRELRNNQKATFRDDLIAVLNDLAAGKPLPKRMFDHALSGEFKGSRECHVYPDLLLIYCVREDSGEIVLARLGSHAQLGL
ncbi:MAG: type II toxin-antitoxin system YafQ family toxin [Burkholderiales bacterium]|jgi:mRNA interferase YafQ|nr:type II toxin-antitoxin system YafQ family toxin [Burkholderiales bacterium]